jgi:hypothetical protein
VPSMPPIEGVGGLSFGRAVSGDGYPIATATPTAPTPPVGEARKSHFDPAVPTKFQKKFWR